MKKLLFLFCALFALSLSAQQQSTFDSRLLFRYEAEFLENSYGYRPNKSALSAVKKVQENVRKYSWVIDLDIKEFFENVNHVIYILKNILHITGLLAVNQQNNRWLNIL